LIASSPIACSSNSTVAVADTGLTAARFTPRSFMSCFSTPSPHSAVKSPPTSIVAVVIRFALS
jgi:hypothetical protein